MHVDVLHNAVSPHDTAADQDVLVQVAEVAAALTHLGHSSATLACTLDLAAARGQLAARRTDLVFNLVESLGGSDWLGSAAAALLDTMGLPYTGSPTEALVLTNHKLLAKQRLRQAGLPTPEWVTLDARRTGGATDSLDPSGFVPGAAYVVKTLWEHASFELDEHSMAQPADELALHGILREAVRRTGRPCFAERYVEGREFNLSVLAGTAGPDMLPPAEIDFSAFPPGKPRIVGRRAKWDEGSFDFQNTPRSFDFASADAPLLDRLCQLARQAWSLFALRGYARIDFRVDRAGQPWILEINANPCLSPDAGFAAALDRASIPFDQAVARILEDALR
jgi:D-alanine-D-alanine ligase